MEAMIQQTQAIGLVDLFLGQFKQREKIFGHQLFLNFQTYQKHAGYINQAKINREGNKGYFKAYKYDETPVQLGDILAYSHEGGTWDANGTDTYFAGHGDICTKIESGYAWCIGGNLSNTVKYAKYKLTSTNYLQVGGSGGKPTDFLYRAKSPKRFFK